MTPEQFRARHQAIINLPEARLRKATARHLTRTTCSIDEARRILGQAVEDTTGIEMAPANKTLVERMTGARPAASAAALAPGLPSRNILAEAMQKHIANGGSGLGRPK